MDRPERRSSTEIMKRAMAVLAVLAVAAGVGGRLVAVARPFDYRQLAPWREADYTQIARNFYRDGLNIFYPRIDWRGDTPGYAEMELPVIPWIGAALDTAFGYREWLVRLPATACGLLSLFAFSRLARRVLPREGSLIATAAFALSPLMLFLANAMQPDPLMILLSILAVDRIWAWEEEPRPARLALASLLTGAAILAKSPAICLGLVFADAVLRVRGARAFTRLETYLGGALALLPPAAWYTWANHFWKAYGLSLGLSNESHYLGLDMLWPPRFLGGIAFHEVLIVFTPVGCLLAAAAIWLKGPGLRRILPWYVATAVFYLVTARTSGDRWSFYYHALSAAPAALLIGCGAARLCFGGEPGAPQSRRLEWSRLAGWLLVAGTLVGSAGAACLLIHKRDVKADWQGMQRCAREFVPMVPEGQSIVVRGGPMFDEYGHPVAHNESMFFAWMDRKGFNYADEQLGLPELGRIAGRGGRYWIALESELDRRHLREEAAREFAKLASCEGGFELFDLTSRPQTPSPGTGESLSSDRPGQIPR